MSELTKRGFITPSSAKNWVVHCLYGWSIDDGTIVLISSQYKIAVLSHASLEISIVG